MILKKWEFEPEGAICFKSRSHLKNLVDDTLKRVINISEKLSTAIENRLAPISETELAKNATISRPATTAKKKTAITPETRLSQK